MPKANPKPPRKPKVDKRGRVSAGILLWRRRAEDGELQVLLGHPGGPYFRRKDAGEWTVLKGEIDDAGEEPTAVARREFEEETGQALDPGAELVPLGEIRQKSGKVVHAWGAQGDLDPETAASNTFELEWPPHSGRVEVFPEIDRVAWFDLVEAREKLKGAQAPFLDRLVAALRHTEG
jgi:predicted NUDIX family NTP pyrophosphohydrolase